MVYVSTSTHRSLEEKGHVLSEKQGKYLSFLEHLLSHLGYQNHQTIPHLRQAHHRENEAVEDKRQDYQHLLALSQLKNHFCVSSLDMMTFYGTLILLLAGQVSIGQAMAAFTFVRSLFFAVSELTDTLSSLPLGKASFLKIDEFVRNAEDVFF